MIIDLQTAREYVTANLPDALLISKINAIEQIVRSETNHSFQDTRIRFYAPVLDGVIQGTHQYITVGDNIQIGESVNEGMYTVTAIESGTIEVDRPLHPTSHNMITKVIYPDAVKMGALNMLKWDLENRSKVGIKSESLSRHSVTYYDMDAQNSAAGYPVALLGFLEPYMQPRF